jgi:hypothetical protein
MYSAMPQKIMKSILKSTMAGLLQFGERQHVKTRYPPRSRSTSVSLPTTSMKPTRRPVSNTSLRFSRPVSMVCEAMENSPCSTWLSSQWLPSTRPPTLISDMTQIRDRMLPSTQPHVTTEALLATRVQSTYLMNTEHAGNTSAVTRIFWFSGKA